MIYRQEKNRIPNTISTKKDIINAISGCKMYIGSSVVFGPDEYVYIGFLIKDINASFIEGDTVTINGDLFTFREIPQEDYDLSLEVSDLASVISQYLTFNDDIPNIIVNSSNILYVSPYGKTYLEVHALNYAEGDTLTVGDITYTCRDTPVEATDFPSGDENTLNELLLLNPSIVGRTASEVLLLATSDTIVNSSIPESFELITMPGVKTIDTKISTHIFNLNSDLEEIPIRMPYFGIPGLVLNLINIGEGAVLLLSSINGTINPYSLDSMSAQKVMYIADIGWIVLNTDGSTAIMFISDFNSGEI